jgi:hypothetical protein
MRPNTTTKYVTILNRNKVALESIKLCVEIIGLILVLLTLSCYVWLAFLQKHANEINRKALAATQRGLDLAQQGISLNQKSLELTQAAVFAAQASAKFAERANSISQSSLKTSSTPWIEVNILRYKETNTGVDVDYHIKNNSSTPATDVTAACTIGENLNVIDLAGMSGPDENNFVIMPNQTVSYHASLFRMKGASNVIQDVEAGRVTISVVVNYRNALGDRLNFVESFSKQNGVFVVEHEEYNVPWKEMEKIYGYDKLPKRPKK